MAYKGYVASARATEATCPLETQLAAAGCWRIDFLRLHTSSGGRQGRKASTVESPNSKSLELQMLKPAFSTKFL